MNLRPFLMVVAGLAVIGYPVLVYLGIDSLGVTTLALLLSCLILARLLLSGDWRRRRNYLLALALCALCVLAIYWDSPAALKTYPVFMNLAGAALFGFSLAERESLIERIAARFEDLESKPPEARCYMRRLSAVWAVLLCGNAGVAAYTVCCMSTEAWALYNGLIAYVLMGLFIVGEFVFRYYFRRNLARNAPTNCAD